MNRFCTYCDRGYAARMLCLYESLVAQGEPFRLYVLCFDAETERIVRETAQASLVAISLDEFMAADPAYATTRSQRSPVEFYFTATPVLIRHCLAQDPCAPAMTYLDADLYFFRPPSAVLAEIGAASVGLVPHRFPLHLADRRKYGTYNVGWVYFRRDPDGLACLEWWRTCCLEWCRDQVEGGRFADQGYLDEFAGRFRGVLALAHPGINAAPWNMAGIPVRLVVDRVQVAGSPLLFYHFQGVREIAPGWFEPGLRQYGAGLSSELRELVYVPYLKKLAAVQRRLQRQYGLAPKFLYHRLNASRSWADRWARFKARWILPYAGRFTGRLVRAVAH